MSRRNSKQHSVMSLAQVYALMMRYGISRQGIDSIREALIFHSVTESKNIRYDRIYSAVAIMLHRRYKLSGPEILKALRMFDEICGSVLDDDETGKKGKDWTEIMRELADEAGIVIRSGDDNRLIIESNFEDLEYIETEQQEEET